MQKKKIIGLTQTILQVFEENQNRAVSCKEIYAEVKKRAHLTPHQLEIAYQRPRFHHSVRNTLQRLMENGKVIRVGEGEYRKATSYAKAKKTSA
jgi:hypothetical protein